MNAEQKLELLRSAVVRVQNARAHWEDTPASANYEADKESRLAEFHHQLEELGLLVALAVGL